MEIMRQKEKQFPDVPRVNPLQQRIPINQSTIHTV
jgi:hypothetical protein